MKQTKQTQLRFVWLVVLGMLAFVLSGCGASSYEIIASASYLPTSAQVERDRIILAIPNDLRARLEAAVQESKASAQLGANRQFVAQMPNPRYLMQKKLLEVVLGWAGQKPPEERVAEQTERLQQPTNELTLEDPRIQYGAGVVAGAAIGTVPLGPYAAEVAIELHALPKGTYHARVGKCAGELISGVIQMAAGCSGMTTGIGMTGTGGGAPAGVIVISASFALAANGYATTTHALDEAQRLWKDGPPPDAPASTPSEQLLKPKTRPKQPATTAPPVQAAPAKPAPQAQPAKPLQPAKPDSKTATSTTKPKQAPPGQTQQPVTTSRGGDSPAAARGRQVHEEFKEKVKAKKEKNPGWDEKPKIYDETGKELRPDALTPSGHPLELKPNTPSGRAAGARQIKKYETVTGKKGRVLYYDP
jgi:hypothetical protein